MKLRGYSCLFDTNFTKLLSSSCELRWHGSTERLMASHSLGLTAQLVNVLYKDFQVMVTVVAHGKGMLPRISHCYTVEILGSRD